MHSKARHRVMSAIGGLGLAGGIALGTGIGSASAVTVSLSPTFQAVASLSPASWGGAWGGNAPYTVSFYYGDGTSTILFTTRYTSRGYEHEFCSRYGHEYTQSLYVSASSGGYGQVNAKTQVGANQRC